MLDRRRFLGTLACTALAGCSLLSSPKPLKITFQNFTPSKHAVEVSLTHGGEEVYSQYIEAPAGSETQKPKVDTLVSLADISHGDRVEVTATLVGTNTSVEGYKTFNCPDEYRYELLFIEIDADGTLELIDDSAANLCSDTGIETPQPADQWG